VLRVPLYAKVDVLSRNGELGGTRELFGDNVGVTSDGCKLRAVLRRVLMMDTEDLSLDDSERLIEEILDSIAGLFVDDCEVVSRDSVEDARLDVIDSTIVGVNTCELTVDSGSESQEILKILTAVGKDTSSLDCEVGTEVVLLEDSIAEEADADELAVDVSTEVVLLEDSIAEEVDADELAVDVSTEGPPEIFHEDPFIGEGIAELDSNDDTGVPLDIVADEIVDVVDERRGAEDKVVLLCDNVDTTIEELDPRKLDVVAVDTEFGDI
jgi:hypothetical protein